MNGGWLGEWRLSSYKCWWLLMRVGSGRKLMVGSFQAGVMLHEENSCLHYSPG